MSTTVKIGNYASDWELVESRCGCLTLYPYGLQWHLDRDCGEQREPWDDPTVIRWHWTCDECLEGSKEWRSLEQAHHELITHRCR